MGCQSSHADTGLFSGQFPEDCPVFVGKEAVFPPDKRDVVGDVEILQPDLAYGSAAQGVPDDRFVQKCDAAVIFRQDTDGIHIGNLLNTGKSADI